MTTEELSVISDVMESLMAMIEYAEATKRYADAGSLKRVATEIEILRAKVAELEAGSKVVAEVILIFDKTDKTFVRDADELMKLAGLNPDMGYEAVGMQDDGTPVVFDCCGNFGYLDERYSPVITAPRPVNVPDGYVLAKNTASQEMKFAAMEAWDSARGSGVDKWPEMLGLIYKAMLAAQESDK